MSEANKDVMSKADDDAIKWALGLIEQVPKTSSEVTEAHLTAVLIVFWGALWGTFGTEYAKGFIEAQLRGMNGPAEKFIKQTH